MKIIPPNPMVGHITKTAPQFIKLARLLGLWLEFVILNKTIRIISNIKASPSASI